MSSAEPSAESLTAPPASVAQSVVAHALAELSTLRERSLDEHPDVYQAIHAELQGALADIDDA